MSTNNTELLFDEQDPEETMHKREVRQRMENMSIRPVFLSDTAAWGERGNEIWFLKTKRGEIVECYQVGKHHFVPPTMAEIAEYERAYKKLAGTYNKILGIQNEGEQQ